MSVNSRAPDEGSFFARHEEMFFILGVFLGVAVFALGIAFTILAFSMSTTPPAPYFESATQRYLTAAIAIVAIVAGAALVRVSARIGGW